MILNNQASLLRLSITSETLKERKLKTLKKVCDLYDKAIFESSQNLIPNLNKALVEWESGDKSDEQFILFLLTDVSKHDPISAKLLFFIFTNRITGFHGCRSTLSKVLKQV